VNTPIFLSLDILLYFDALITHMIKKIVDNVIFKVKYLKTDFFLPFSSVSRAPLSKGGSGMEVISHGSHMPLSRGGGRVGVASRGSHALLSKGELGCE